MANENKEMGVGRIEMPQKGHPHTLEEYYELQLQQKIRKFSNVINIEKRLNLNEERTKHLENLEAHAFAKIGELEGIVRGARRTFTFFGALFLVFCLAIGILSTIAQREAKQLFIQDRDATLQYYELKQDFLDQWHQMAAARKEIFDLKYELKAMRAAIGMKQGEYDVQFFPVFIKKEDLEAIK